MLPKRAVVLWTGGKDCNLALYEAKQQGYDIVALLSFAIGGAKFRAHPIKIMQQQAAALGIPHVVIPVQEPYAASYEDVIFKIKEEFQIDTIVTGDIAEVHGNINWITERSKPAGIKVLLPLWHLNREQILQQLISLDFKIIFSCVKEPWFSITWLGREMNAEAIAELKALHEHKGLDICGEQGEYHTLVLDGPLYKKAIAIDAFNSEKNDHLMFMDITQTSITEKQLI